MTQSSSQNMENFDQTPKVSVIVPIYGVESYIEECVRSLMEQTLDNVEYIFVNDCTPDKSIEILHKVLNDYPERKPFVRLLENEVNVGQAATRKRGIISATGEYVIHCDSDDIVDRDWLKILYNKAVLKDADISWCGFDSLVADGTVRHFDNRAEDNLDDFLVKLETGVKWGSLCLHLVKREIVQAKSIKWPTWNYCEDLALIFQYAAQAKGVAYADGSLYKYRQNLDSITSQRGREGLIQNIHGEIFAILQGIEIYRNLCLDKRHRANLLTRIYLAKSRLWITALDSKDFCSLWHQCPDNMKISDIWASTLSNRDKIVNTLIYLKIYPYLKQNK